MTPRPAMPNQDGFALLALLLLAAMGTAAFLLGQRDLAAVARTHAQARTVLALAQARAALAGYALSYPERHPGQGHGYLPCPDGGNDGHPAGACGARDLGAIGRFPYRTLGSADLRDGWGECLWYAVAGSVKNNPKPPVLNWDAPGQFDLVGSGGIPLAGADASTARAVAVVLAPGPVLPAQLRPPVSGKRCGGSDSSAGDLADYLDAAYPPRVDGPLTIRQGTADGALNNDLLAWLTVDDIFDALRRRTDFAAHIDALVERAAVALDAASRTEGFLDRHATALSAALAGGPLPGAEALALAGPEADAHDNWRDQFRFLACADGSACITAELRESVAAPGPAALETCRLALLFGGERIRGGTARQSRDGAAARADPANYFENGNPAVLTHGSGRLSGYRHFTAPEPARPAHEDVIRCLP